MKEKKLYIVFDEYEQGVLLNSLVEMKNKLIKEGKYTDAVDELIVKVGKAKIKKLKIE